MSIVNRRNCSPILIPAILWLTLCWIDATAFAQTSALKALATNSRYFTDGSGRAILLTGSHTWNSFQDTDQSASPAALDFNSYVGFLKAHGHNATILWKKDLPTYCNWGAGGTWHMTPHPWLRTGGAGGAQMASDGLPAFDLSQLNQAYFDRLRARALQLQQNGIYAIVQLFDGLGLLNNRCSTDGYPFSGGNNVNGVNDGGGANSMTMSAPNTITNYQDAYVRKVIDTVNDLTNVLWEISEEAPGNSTWWQGHMISLIHSYEAGKPLQHPVGFPWLTGGSDSTIYSSNADWVAPSARISPTSSCGPGTPACKVNINDSDHSYYGLWNDSAQTNRNYIWENFVSGDQVIFMDPYEIYWTSGNRNLCSNPVNGVCNAPDPRWNNFRDNLGYALAYANKMNLANMTPQGGLTSTGYALANAVAAGAEYLVYAPSGGFFTVDLSATTSILNAEWFDPSTGVKTSSGTVAGGSSSQPFTPPFGNDAVLYLIDSGSAPPDTTPPSVPANLTATAASSSQINVSWTPSTDPDSPVAGYTVYRNGSQIGTATSGTTYSDTGLSPSTQYSYTLTAFDAAGNYSAQSSPAAATTLAVSSPGTIQLVQHTGIDCGTTPSCSLRFPNNTVSGNFIVLGLRVGHALGSVTVTDTTGNNYILAVTRSSPNDIHQLYIYYAQNIPGGATTVTVSLNTPNPILRMTIAEYSGIALFGALDQAASLVGNGTAVSSGSVTTTQANELLIGVGANANGVAWAGGAGWTLRDQPAGKVADEDQIVGSATTTSASFTLASSDYWTAAIATFKGGSPSDTTPPSLPTNVTATAASSSQINLSWTASTDPDSPVAGYTVYRSGSQIANVTNSTTYSDSSLTPNTSYSYTVSAYDSAGNRSGQCSPATATTKPFVDTTAPSIPTNATATAASSSQINVSWTPSTDPDSPVAGYALYRNGSQIANVTIGATYSDTGLSPSTQYSYTLTAYDAAGNYSAQSSPAAATTLAASSPGTIQLVQHTGSTAEQGLHALSVSPITPARETSSSWD